MIDWAGNWNMERCRQANLRNKQLFIINNGVLTMT